MSLKKQEGKHKLLEMFPSISRGVGIERERAKESIVDFHVINFSKSFL